MPNVVQAMFSLTEAQALQGRTVRATQDYTDEHDRILIPQGALCRVIGLDAWDAYDAGIAVQYHGEFPKVVLMNKTTYREHFENLSVS
jgi:hypothetical protein